VNEKSIEALLRADPPQSALQWVSDIFGSTSPILNVTPLYGGKSHATHRVDLRGPTHDRSVVLRRWARPDWRDDNADYTAAHEAATLQLLERGGVKAPRLIAVDDTPEHADVPAVLETLVLGEKPRITATTLGPITRELASAAAAVHQLSDEVAQKVAIPYVRYYPVDELHIPPWSMRPGLWEEAIEIFAQPPPSTEMTFIHRDYYVGNTLFKDGTLSGILDWERGSWGPVAVDISHMRVNLANEGQMAAVDLYTQAYKTITGRRLHDLAFWDVIDAVDLLPEMMAAAPEAQLRFENFVASALLALQ
jgi:aminoglycoside/choline kinase family phosphotransferase